MEQTKSVYILMSGEGYGRVLGVFSDKDTATHHADLVAQVNYGIDFKHEPLDFDGSLARYGWADRVWWQREVLY